MVDTSNRFSNWLRDRLGLDELPFFRTPDYMYKANYWLGALVASAFVYAVVSGLILLLYYNPADPYDQTQYIINSVPYGSVVLFSHLYAAYAMILLAYVHMFRNYFVGAYKAPRELVWLAGVLLLVLTMGASFVGYSLVGDVLGVDAVGVGEGILGSFPGGSVLNALFFGNGTTQDTFTRLLAWHIILVALIGLLFGLHFFMAERYGIMPTRRVKPTAPAVYTKEEESKFNPWWPRNFVYMMSLMLMTWGLILIVPNVLANVNGLPLLLNPHPAPSPSSPQAASVPAYPPWFFLFFYKIADFLMPNGAPYPPFGALLVAVLIPMVYLLLLPFLDRGKELHPFGRKFWTWVGVMLITYLVEMSVWGYLAPGVPEPFTDQVKVLLPPAVIAAIGVYAMGRTWSRRKVSLESPVLPKGTGPSPVTAFGLVVLGMLAVGTVGLAINDPTVPGGAAAVALVLAFAAFARGFWRRSSGNTNQETVNRKARITLAETVMAVLFVVAVVLAFNMWTVPSTGPQSSLFGVDLGALLLMLGEALSLYHYANYAVKASI
ncbi:cytochrome b6 [Sulfodiicoccus acidiphilus]|uniref:Cytochrome b6 n=1 Tax=Sulfodiicoccus acidiphilus TaxID=1670455 RepID=A0A348B249_9CREN|nr:proton pump complex cytochrome B SoxC [Sulfodiicoccus acidiphilus]BBD72251.1 cytochrome b6 [Sulfodiicoccus acidiphilus]GGT90780.1 cytochrome b6 [Sulfodiicoccus acidiphilus]